jgi:DNA-binding NarL/FixJ family response regulator
MTLINHRPNGYEADIPAKAMPNTTPLRTLLVDDNAHFLRAARDHLERDGITIVGIATTSAEALRQAGNLTPDVALIDIMLGTEFGFDLAHALKRAVLEPPRMIMMSCYPATDFAEMIGAGPAIGFVPKLSLSGSAIRALVNR